MQVAEKILEEILDQRYILPGYYTWEQFISLDSLMSDTPGLRITYLDGLIEFMTLGEKHEITKSLLGVFIELYFFEKEINFIPVGSATRRDEGKTVSFEPDESYYIGTKKDHPDLAIEVIITSGNIDKLTKYQRLKITEVWFWENNQISIYRLQGNNYQRISQSEFLPDLDISLLIRCLMMDNILTARKEFINGINN